MFPTFGCKFIGSPSSSCQRKIQWELEDFSTQFYNANYHPGSMWSEWSICGYKLRLIYLNHCWRDSFTNLAREELGFNSPMNVSQSFVIGVGELAMVKARAACPTLVFKLLFQITAEVDVFTVVKEGNFLRRGQNSKRWDFQHLFPRRQSRHQSWRQTCRS